MIATHEIGPYKLKVIHGGRGQWSAKIAVADMAVGFCIYTNGKKVIERTKEKLLTYLEYAHGEKVFEFGCKCRRCNAR